MYGIICTKKITCFNILTPSWDISPPWDGPLPAISCPSSDPDIINKFKNYKYWQSIKECTIRNLNNSIKIQSLTMYLHSSSNRKFHHRLCCWYQCLQHHVLSRVSATSKIINIRQFNKLIKTNTCINKMICINKMKHVEILPWCRLFSPQIKPHQVHYHPH